MSGRSADIDAEGASIARDANGAAAAAVDPLGPTMAPAANATTDVTPARGDAVAVTGEGFDPGLTATATDGAALRPRATPATRAGTTLAHYRLERLLGRGGMGEVYLATDTALERSAAVKLLPSDVARDPDLRERFYREARAQARLQHPNVCHIYYVGEDDGQVFFAMEYIEGESLQARLAREGKIPFDEAVELCRMAALGLREAHAHGFTHRDIKPSNLMVDKNGVVKVVDFGLVKHMGAAKARVRGDSEARDTAAEDAGPAQGDAGASAEVELALTGVVGTPLYMAPEQGEGKVVDFRADIYALGATLHHLVSGQPPFAGSTAMELITRHRSEVRPTVKVQRREASAVDSLCDQMMAKQPRDRFENYDALVDAMERASRRHTRPAGFWVRGFAFGIDALLVLLTTALVTQVLPVDEVVVWSTLAFVYAIAAHGRRGQTLGKSLLEIEVIPASGGDRIGFVRAALRILAQFGPYLIVRAIHEGLLAAGVALGWVGFGLEALRVLAVVMIPLDGALAAWLSPSKRTVWDRIAGTQVRYQRGASR